MNGKATRVVRAIRVEIAKPLPPMTWDELGVMLRTQRKIIPQLLRAGMDARIACGVVGAAVAKEKLSPETKGGSPQSVVYQSMLAALERIKAGKWQPASRPALELSGKMVSQLSQQVQQSYAKRPGYNGSQPIPVCKADVKLIAEDGGVVLDVKLVSAGRVRMALTPSRGAHWRTLTAIAAGTIAHGDCKIVYDEDRRKWYALVAYDAPVEQRQDIDTSRALVVHRGVRNALTFMATTGHHSTESGAKLFHQLSTLEARMKETRRVSAETLGSGARGHGKARRFEHYDALNGKRSNVVKTWCQQMAALVCRRAVENGAGTIVIEEYGGIDPSADVHLRRALIRFPLYQLKQSIVNAAQVRGLVVEEVPAEYVSSVCPACGCNDFRQHNYRTGVFHCLQCSLERPADFVAALNMLRRSGVDSSLWDERMAKFEKLRRDLADNAAE